MDSNLFIILILLNICHWAADFTHLSTDWMLNAKRFGKPLYPIFMHAMVHAVLFFGVVVFLDSLEHAIFAGLFQLTTHFLIDLAKGKITFAFREIENPANKFHWWLFGFDQLLHHLVILLTVYWISLN